MGRVHRLDSRVEKNPCRKNTVSEKVLHGRHSEVYSLKLCKYLIFKQLGNIKFPKKDSKIKGRMLFFCIKKKRTKRKIYIFSSLFL